MEILKIVGKRVRARRLSLGMSQEALADGGEKEDSIPLKSYALFCQQPLQKQRLLWELLCAAVRLYE